MSLTTQTSNRDPRHSGRRIQRCRKNFVRPIPPRSHNQSPQLRKREQYRASEKLIAIRRGGKAGSIAGLARSPSMFRPTADLWRRKPLPVALGWSFPTSRTCLFGCQRVTHVNARRARRVSHGSNFACVGDHIASPVACAPSIGRARTPGVFVE
jgi:hypothetical protein